MAAASDKLVEPWSNGNRQSALRIGCCGFGGAQRAYWERFRLVELQQTFYQPPRVATAERWRAEAPPHADFTLKAWQLVTHAPTSPTYRRLRLPVPAEHRGRYGGFQPTKEVRQAWLATRAIAEALRARAIVFQCPASFQPSRENVRNLETFFEGIDRGALLLVWEPRGPWPTELIAGLCSRLDLVHCVDPFRCEAVTGGLVYYRLHGVGGYAYSYSREDLERLRALCRNRGGFVLFNNITMRADAEAFAAMTA